MTGRQKEILLISHEPDTAVLLQSGLDSLINNSNFGMTGFRVVSCQNSSETDVITDIRFKNPAAVVLEPFKPDGEEEDMLIRIIRHIPYSHPLIVISRRIASTNDEDGTIRWMSAGADQYVEDPQSSVVVAASVLATIRRDTIMNRQH